MPMTADNQVGKQKEARSHGLTGPGVARSPAPGVESLQTLHLGVASMFDADATTDWLPI